MGTPAFAVPTLRALVESGHQVASVLSQPDRPSGRGQRLTAPPVKEAALELGLDVFPIVELDSYILDFCLC